MADYQYHATSERLMPRNVWAGGRITSTETVTLNEAARLASQHAGAEITPADFLRAAARGEILLRALCSRAVIMLPISDEDEPLQIAENSLPTLPLGACKSIANIGRATWRIYEKTKLHEDPFLGRTFIRFTAWELPENEADLIVHLDDCRVTGHDVHALADAYVKAPEQTATPEPLVTESASDTPTTGRIMKLSALIAELEFEWSTVREDIREATRNGLKDAAHSGKYGMWDCEKARAWAVSMGKIKRDTPVHSLTGAWAGSITRNKIGDR